MAAAAAAYCSASALLAMRVEEKRQGELEREARAQEKTDCAPGRPVERRVEAGMDFGPLD